MTRKERTPNPEKALEATFANRTVRGNIKNMFAIGTRGMHESAFAVYQKPDGSYSSSRLLAPNPEQEYADNEENAHARYMRINIASLVDAKNAYGAFDESMLTDHDRATIAGINADEDMTAKEKYDLIDVVEERARRRSKGMNGEGFRTDIALDVHNHPIQHYTEPIVDVLMPSPQDVSLSQRIAAVNPGHISGIVAATESDEQAILLYGAESNRDQDANRYDFSMDYSRGGRRNLELLGKCGFISTIILLDPTGSVSEGQDETIRDFARQIKTV